MRRHVVVKPAWRARVRIRDRAYPVINLWERDYEAIKVEAQRTGETMRAVADRVISRMLDVAGVP